MNDLSQPDPASTLSGLALPPGALAGPWLVADIGGTNARFGYVAAGSGQVGHVASLRGAEHAVTRGGCLDRLQRALPVAQFPVVVPELAQIFEAECRKMALINSPCRFANRLSS